MLNEELLRADVDAKEERMKSILWAPGEPAADQNWSALLSTPSTAGSSAPSSPHSAMAPVVTSTIAPSPPLPSEDQTLRVAALEQTAKSLLGTERQRRSSNGQLPDWLLEAAGNPLTYDAREGRRTNVCARILPSTYTRLKQTKARLGLRSIAGTWEYILRLGLAAAASYQQGS